MQVQPHRACVVAGGGGVGYCAPGGGIQASPASRLSVCLWLAKRAPVCDARSVFRPAEGTQRIIQWERKKKNHTHTRADPPYNAPQTIQKANEKKKGAVRQVLSPSPTRNQQVPHPPTQHFNSNTATASPRRYVRGE